MGNAELPVLGHWERFLAWLFAKTAQFPRRLRPTLTARIETRALSILEGVVCARYTPERRAILEQVNLDLEVLRVLIRLAHAERCLNTAAYEYSARELHESGRMIGGWLKSVK